MPRRCGVCRQEGHNRITCPVLEARRDAERIAFREEQDRISAIENLNYNNSGLTREEFFRRAHAELQAEIAIRRVRELVERATTPPRATTPQQVLGLAKRKIPTHIAEQVWELNEPDCMVCLDKIEKENYILSTCGHNYCKNCFNDSRVDKCGECRQSLY